MENRRLIRVLFIPILILTTLIACSKPTVQPTPTSSVTPVPSLTSTPLPTSTPHRTPTPATLPTPNIFEILPAAGEICETAFASPVISGSAVLSMVTLIKTEFEDNAEWAFLDVPHQALSASSISTLVCVMEGRILEGSYSDGKAAYRPTWTIRLVGWLDGQVYEEIVFRGSAPPMSKSGSGDGYGVEPRIAFLEWLALTFDDLTYFVAGYVDDIAVSPDGEYLASAASAWLKIWSISTGRQVLRIGEEYDHIYLSVAFSPDGLTLASGHRDSSISLWNVETGEKLRNFTGHTDDVTSLAFSPDGQLLVSGSRDKSIRLWRIETGDEITSMLGHTSRVGSVVFSTDGLTLASAGYDDTVRLWSVETGQELLVIQGPPDFVKSIALSPDGQYMATGGNDNSVRLWNLTNGDEIRTMSGHVGYVNSVVFSPDGQYIASGSGDGTVRLWDVESGLQISILRGHISAINDVVFLPDGQTLASGSHDTTVRIWKIRSDE